MKVNVTKLANDMVTATQNYQTVTSILVNTLKARKMAKVHTNFVTELDMLVIIIKTKNMAKVSSTIRTDQSMMATGKTIVRTESAHILTLMVMSTKASGIKKSDMVKELIAMRTWKAGKADGPGKLIH